VKRLTFTVTVEDLPDHAKNYRVQGTICTVATKALSETYCGQVNVIVTPAVGPALVDANAFAKLRQEARPA
jgi:hypothetical protein